MDEQLRWLLTLPAAEKAARFDAMVRGTFSHVNGRDLLRELHPRNTLDIKRRVDGRETWFEADWLSDLMQARDMASDWAQRPMGAGQQMAAQSVARPPQQDENGVWWNVTQRAGRGE